MVPDQPTARGDRTQRRLDVINAAASILEESGWAGLNMREVASRAGVSAGALYQWFAGKDEIYAELYTARIANGIESFEAIPDDMSLEELLISMFRWVRRTWSDLGRWQLEFAEISRTRENSEPLRTLAAAHQTLLETGMRTLAGRAAAAGVTMRTDDRTAHLLWATASGIATRAEVLQFDDEMIDELTRMAATSLIAGLTESA